MKVAALWQRLQQRFGMETANLWLVINSHLLRLALGLVSSVAIARALGPAGLSAYAITGTVIMIGITLGKGGLRESSIRALAGRSDQAARPIIRSMVQMRLVGLLIVVLIVVLAAQPLATLLNLPRPAGRDYLWLAALSILATSSSDVIGTLLHARQRFAGLVWSQTVNAALTVPLVVSPSWLRSAQPVVVPRSRARMQDRLIAPSSGRTSCAGIGVFIVKAHKLWAFGFGRSQNT